MIYGKEVRRGNTTLFFMVLYSAFTLYNHYTLNQPLFIKYGQVYTMYS